MAKEILIDFFKGKHTIGQLTNLTKSLISSKKTILNWDPLYLSIFLTYNCTLNCDMCLTHSTKFQNQYGQKPCADVDFDLFKTILDTFPNAIGVRLTGNGDSFLNKDFFKMIRYASINKKMDVSSSSNGLLLDKFINELLVSNLNNFNISINGYNSKEFNRMTGMSPELFHIICENTASLLEQKKAKRSKMRITASFILDNKNYNSILDMINIANDLGVDAIAFYHFLSSPVKGFSCKERCLFSDNLDVLDVFNQVNLLPKELRRKVILPPLLDRNMKNNKYCSTWFYNMSFDGNRNVGGCCCQLLDLSLSGFFDGKSAWNNEYFQKMRSRFVYANSELLEPCTWCYQNSSANARIPFRLSDRIRHKLSK